ncbi:hypothetical protein ACQPZ8_20370 [Actinomadura nitritigenes]|uniref:hypothetical protein n=1 Tax=Actinomadura nitritigenes TaxID=134602 RepID=UPI003D90059B
MALNSYPARPPKPEEAIAMTGGTVISTDRAPSLDAPLFQGVRRGPLVQVSGQLPHAPGTGTVIGATVAEQRAAFHTGHPAPHEVQIASLRVGPKGGVREEVAP